ncbi:hypothetical protein [Paracoccus mutanolyticus]|uniref:hypothetical protein n=1 Tax=Paracoccus mutanolyticus TaxID=1499308 RepID=UPI00167C06B4|nr:hypothetical protein [Paracoccus mutanolyticus]
MPRLYDHDRCYFFQGSDGRIIFAIPYEQDFTLIGTTLANSTGCHTPGQWGSSAGQSCVTRRV